MTVSRPAIQFNAVKTLHTSNGSLPLDIAFNLAKGSLFTIYGDSGAGKTTILRILAGLTEIESGHIEVDGEVWYDTDQGINKPANKRSIGFVFQDFALFPHLNVKQQLEFALQKGDDKNLVSELIELMELTSLQDRRPSFLSGGQQQRIILSKPIGITA
jgi:molybdate transport system ATP-binding protein